MFKCLCSVYSENNAIRKNILNVSYFGAELTAILSCCLNLYLFSNNSLHEDPEQSKYPFWSIHTLNHSTAFLHEI